MNKELLNDFLNFKVKAKKCFEIIEISKKEAKLLKVATSDNVLTVPQEIKDNLRARIFKNMLVNLVED